MLSFLVGLMMGIILGFTLGFILGVIIMLIWPESIVVEVDDDGQI